MLCAVLRRTESKLGATEKELRASETERAEQGKRLKNIETQLDQKEKELQEWYECTNQLPLAALCDLLKCQAPVKKLDLKGERLNSLKHTLLKKQMKTQNWTGSKFGGGGAKTLGEALKVNTTLQTLDLWSEQ